MGTLSSTELSRYDGGQLEVQNEIEGYKYRGEIKTARIIGSSVVVTLVWEAKMGRDGQWHASSHTDYRASLEIYRVSLRDNGRLVLESWITGELTVFFPPDYPQKLDRSKVLE